MKQVWEYRTEELAEMYAIAQCEIERLQAGIKEALEYCSPGATHATGLARLTDVGNILRRTLIREFGGE